MAVLEERASKSLLRDLPNFNPPTATPPTFLQPAPTLALLLSPRPALRLPIRPNQSKMTTMPSYFLDSNHDELLARCHSDRANRVGSDTPKLMSSLDYEPAARCTDSDMAGFQSCASAEDSAVVTRTHSFGRRRSSVFDESNAPKLMSSFDIIPLPADAASAASTPASSSLDVFLSSSAGFGRLNVQCKMI